MGEGAHHTKDTAQRAATTDSHSVHEMFHTSSWNTLFPSHLILPPPTPCLHG